MAPALAVKSSLEKLLPLQSLSLSVDAVVMKVMRWWWWMKMIRLLTSSMPLRLNCWMPLMNRMMREKSEMAMEKVTKSEEMAGPVS